MDAQQFCPQRRCGFGGYTFVLLPESFLELLHHLQVLAGFSQQSSFLELKLTAELIEAAEAGSQLVVKRSFALLAELNDPRVGLLQPGEFAV